MKIYESSVKKPITTALIFVAVVVLGLFSFSKLSIDMLPEIEMNQAIVMVNYPGASAEDVENNITKPLENVLSTVSELKKIRSTSKDNISIINIEFNWGVDLDEKSNDIRDKIEFVKQALPDGSSNPMILKFSTDMIPVMFISATSEESTNGLYKLLEDGVANPLNRINGVGTVSIAGAPKREISVNVDPKKLEAYNLTIEQIGQKIGLENLNTPGGSIDVGSETYALRIEGELKESDKLKDIIMTIQQEQDNLIRQPKNRTIVVDGVAGSGKTTVALHRVAYLLYNYRKTLQNKVLILGPNNIFMEYISMVLPSLGEGGVKQATFKDFALELIGLDHVMSLKDYMEKILIGDQNFIESILYKNSVNYINELDKLVVKLNNCYFKIRNVELLGKVISTKEEIEELFNKYFNSMPLFKRSKRIKRIIYSKIKDRRTENQTIP